MKKSITSIIFLVLLTMPFMSGCATNDGPEYDGSSYENMKRIQVGTVASERPVTISDSGGGKFLGAIIGAVLGSTMGSGNGSVLMALGGGLAGGYAGSEINKADAQELTVDLNTGETVVIVVKGDDLYMPGDRIKIIKDGNKVANVERLTPASKNKPVVY